MQTDPWGDRGSVVIDGQEQPSRLGQCHSPRRALLVSLGNDDDCRRLADTLCEVIGLDPLHMQVANGELWWIGSSHADRLVYLAARLVQAGRVWGLGAAVELVGGSSDAQ